MKRDDDCKALGTMPDMQSATINTDWLPNSARVIVKQALHHWHFVVYKPFTDYLLCANML